jgi:hypothetical protein
MDSFSTVIRTASHEQHVEAETSTFMSDLLGGRLGVDAYARYTEQLWFVYEALETGAERLAADSVTGPFIRGELFRLPALESTYSGGQGECLELALDIPAFAPVRDSKTPAGPVIPFGRHAWRTFVAHLD